jgi:outer membrane protein assembly factor BamB
MVWATNFKKAHAFGIGVALTVSPDGSKVFITGSMITPVQHDGWGSAAYNAATGAQLWVVRILNRSNDISGNAIAISPDGSKVFVTGNTSATSGAGEFGTAAYNPATGALLWIASYTRRGSRGGGGSIAVSPDGSKVFVSGDFFDPLQGSFMTTLAYSS